MQKPVIVSLTEEGKIALLKRIECSDLSIDEKEVLGDLVQFMSTLKEKLKKSEITINNLKRLFGCNSETLKKLLQMP